MAWLQESKKQQTLCCRQEQGNTNKLQDPLLLQVANSQTDGPCLGLTLGYPLTATQQQHGSEGHLTHGLWEILLQRLTQKGAQVPRRAPALQRRRGTRALAAATGAAETTTDNAAGTPSRCEGMAHPCHSTTGRAQPQRTSRLVTTLLACISTAVLTEPWAGGRETKRPPRTLLSRSFTSRVHAREELPR